MDSYIEKVNKPGFDFSNAIRNKLFNSQMKPTSTGTTIVGVTCPEGVVIAADTRATANFVAEKNCNKIHVISPNIVCCGAGTAADCDYFTKKISA